MRLYIPSARYLWDFWFAPRRVNGLYHLFHLQAPRSIGDPELRHWVAEIGRATSPDLLTWAPGGTALFQGEPGAWDDRALWTGCTVEHDGMYYLFYTAIRSNDDGPIQRIGVARSVDLVSWQRAPGNPVLTADPRWYETAEMRLDEAEDFRDPFVMFDPDRSEWLMLFCAHANVGPAGGRGVVGLARSADLLNWECLPPLTQPGEFGQLEVPHLVKLQGRWYLTFCTDQHSEARLARTGDAGRWFGTHYLVADELRGPYRSIAETPLLADRRGTYYAGRIETELTGAPLFFAWRRLDERGGFVGGLSNPASVSVVPDGRLSIDASLLWSESD
jgi:beta-fructofuranosidase